MRDFATKWRAILWHFLFCPWMAAVLFFVGNFLFGIFAGMQGKILHEGGVPIVLAVFFSPVPLLALNWIPFVAFLHPKKVFGLDVLLGQLLWVVVGCFWVVLIPEFWFGILVSAVSIASFDMYLYWKKGFHYSGFHSP